MHSDVWSKCSHSSDLHASKLLGQGRFTSRFTDITWSARSPHFVAPDYFIWGYIKRKVHKTLPASTDSLKQRTREGIQGIHKVTLQRATLFPPQLQECCEQYGGHQQIRKIMTNIYSQEHGMHLPVVIHLTGAFENYEKRLSAMSCLSVCPHGTSPLILDRFHEIWYFGIFRNYAEKGQISLKSDKHNRYFTWRPMKVYENMTLYPS
jgi:hypothetical protein